MGLEEQPGSGDRAAHPTGAVRPPAGAFEPETTGRTPEGPDIELRSTVEPVADRN